VPQPALPKVPGIVACQVDGGARIRIVAGTVLPCRVHAAATDRRTGASECARNLRYPGPEQVLKYLARYTHRVAISNRRLLSIKDGCVTFEWKDYRSGSKTRIMTLDAVEFIRRFLLHILPGGFVRIRQFGFLANRARRKKLALCRALLGAPSAPQKHAAVGGQDGKPEERCRKRCPVCKSGHMILVVIIHPAHPIPSPHQHAP
jgi:hypothetical protein